MPRIEGGDLRDTLQRSVPLAEMISERLIEDISFGRIQTGSILSENKLATRFGTSKTPVREALLRLQSLDLLEIRPQRGAVVFSVDRSVVRDLSRFRLLLEVGAFREIYEPSYEDFGQNLSAIVDRMDQAFGLDDPHDYQMLDSEFHRTAVEWSHNEFLISSYLRIDAKVSALRTMLSTPQPYLLRKSLIEHRQIADAVLQGDTRLVEDLLHDHITRTSEFHQRQIGAEGDAEDSGIEITSMKDDISK